MNQKNDNRLDWLDLQRGTFASGQTVQLPVLSGSMLPLLRPDSLITIEGRRWQACRCGDVIVISSRQKLTAHRLLLKIGLGRRGFLYEKGDLNLFGRWIAAGKVVGRVVACQTSDGGSCVLADITDPRTPRAEARRQLVRDALARLLYLPRKVKKWLIPGT